MPLSTAVAARSRDGGVIRGSDAPERPLTTLSPNMHLAIARHDHLKPIKREFICDRIARGYHCRLQNLRGDEAGRLECRSHGGTGVATRTFRAQQNNANTCPIPSSGNSRRESGSCAPSFGDGCYLASKYEKRVKGGRFVKTVMEIEILWGEAAAADGQDWDLRPNSRTRA